MHHLRDFESGDINKKDIPAFVDYKANSLPVPADRAKQLLNRHFFAGFDERDPPSGYLWTYFRKLLFEACRSFSQAMFLQTFMLDNMDNDIKAASKGLHQEIKLRQTFRGEFFSVVLKNCLDFIQRSVRPGLEGEGNALQQTLIDLPFLIIP